MTHERRQALITGAEPTQGGAVTAEVVRQLNAGCRVVHMNVAVHPAGSDLVFWAFVLEAPDEETKP